MTTSDLPMELRVVEVVMLLGVMMWLCARAMVRGARQAVARKICAEEVAQWNLLWASRLRRPGQVTTVAGAVGLVVVTIW